MLCNVIAFIHARPNSIEKLNQLTFLPGYSVRRSDKFHTTQLSVEGNTLCQGTEQDMLCANMMTCSLAAYSQFECEECPLSSSINGHAGGAYFRK